jgi:hypothetical protein
VLEALRSGSIVVNHGTGDPTENEHIGGFLAESGIKYLDAPVSGGRPGAVARTLTTLVGGEADDFARCLGVFETFSRKVAHMGGVGSGQLTKLLNNAMTMTNLKNGLLFHGKHASRRRARARFRAESRQRTRVGVGIASDIWRISLCEGASQMALKLCFPPIRDGRNAPPPSSTILSAGLTKWLRIAAPAYRSERPGKT